MIAQGSKEHASDEKSRKGRGVSKAKFHLKKKKWKLPGTSVQGEKRTKEKKREHDHEKDSQYHGGKEGMTKRVKGGCQVRTTALGRNEERGMETQRLIASLGGGGSGNTFGR